MKKFSSSVDREDVNIVITTPSVSTTLSEMIDNTVGVQYACECYASSKMDIQGKEELIADLLSIAEEESHKSNKILKESLATSFINFYDQNTINNLLKLYEDNLSTNYLVVNPVDVFSKEDYEKIEGGIRLRSLRNVPDVFVDYILTRDSSEYFSEGHYVDIVYGNDSWTLDFGGNIDAYGTSISNDNEKRGLFLKKHGDFIKSFYDATCAFVGANNVSLYNQDIMSIF